MAYTTPPTFADDNVLLASQLNVLSANQEHLKGVLDAPNSPFPSITATSDETVDFFFEHTHRYMHYHFYVSNGSTQDHVHVEIYDQAGSLLLWWENNGNNAGPYTFQGTIDCNSLTVGTWYRANVDIAFFAGSNPIYLISLGEKPTT